MKTTFLGWGGALVPLLAKHLATRWDGKGALDLSDTMVIVPTRNASRRLREALAIHAAKHEAAVLPPLTVTPDFLSSPARLPELRTASPEETLLIWAGELMSLDLNDLREVFPVDPVERNFAWASKAAADLLEVRETLNESGLSMRDVARMVANTDKEPERWQELGELESRCLASVREHGLEDWQEARRMAAANGEMPAEVKRVVVACVLDPSGLAVAALERLSSRVEVEVCVFAPEQGVADLFDVWGRPLPERWGHREIELESPLVAIHVRSNPTEQAGVVLNLLAAYERPGEMAGIGVADSEVIAPLEKALAGSGTETFDPAGKPYATHGVVHVLRLIHQMSTSRSFGTVTEFLHVPDVFDALKHLRPAIFGKTTSAQLLRDLDELASTCLPDTLDDALELWPAVQQDGKDIRHLPEALGWVNEELGQLEEGPFGDALMQWLGTIFADRKFRGEHAEGAVFKAIADEIETLLETVDGPLADRFPGGLTSTQRLEVILRALDSDSYHTERGAGDVDLQGWLELLWEDAPHLIITGMNEGKVPDVIQGHPFLPDSLRKYLGLRHNDSRFARDACLLTSVVAWRKAAGGRVDLVFGRVTAGDEPLRPSRLLFQCNERQLAQRTLDLFEKPDRTGDPMPWTLAWRLKPRALESDAPVFDRLRVTQFRDYLACPFRFYLKHGLGMSSVDVGLTEMDAMDYGSLIHHVLEQFGRDSHAKVSDDENVIREFFHAALDERLREVYGSRLTVPVMIQRESARQRLSWWAAMEVAERRAGWRIVDVERKLGHDSPWKIGAMTITGKVDRIEEHPQRGLRLIDFKTSSAYNAQKKARRSVAEYHLTRIKKTEDPGSYPAWSLVNLGDEVWRWTDLQLPLYLLALETKSLGQPMISAHVTLGRSKADLGLDEWTTLDADLLQSARACAEGVVAAIQGALFWPPAEKVAYADDFDPLFFGDVASAVDPSQLVGASQPAKR
ncbi:MAG: PD-(D/E)XK nuclease family protein [Verrucomicrobiaceae bacterium]|nr:PD-(D/E)XK nuclease family protein [Verrucomicrobiaceae bacterium]